MGRIALLVLSLMPLAGCGTIPATTAGDVKSRYDASAGPETAIIGISGKQTAGAVCGIVQGEDLYREVVADAGAVRLQVECSRFTRVFGDKTQHLGRASVTFVADTGRHYRISFSEDFGFPHVAVSAAGDDSFVVQRSLLGPRLAAHARAANATLVSRSGAGVIPCKFGGPWTQRESDAVIRPAASFLQVPYSHQVVAECATYAYITGYVKERFEALVDFEPKSGRLYTVHMDEEEPGFVFVTDVSSDVQTIAHVRAVRTH